MLNPASVAALFSAVVSLSAVACVFPLGRVPDWEDLRPLTWVALSATLMSAASIPATLDLPPAVHVWTSRLQVMFVALHVLAWLAYLPGWAKQPVRPLPPAVWPLAVLGLLALVPGVAFEQGVSLRPLPWLGVTYRDPVTSPVGIAVWLVIGGYGLWGILRVVRWGKAGAPYPRAHLACTGALFLMGVHDAAVVSGVPLPTPYLLDFASCLPVTVFGVVTLRRISENATEFHRLRSGLETAVADRSRRLEESRTALGEAERMAALGRFSAGIAQEVKQPAAAAAASLELLARDLAGVPDEVLHKLEDARRGVQQIVVLARQLLLAGHTASAAAPPLVPVRLSWAMEPSLALARARAQDRASLRVSLPDDLWVLAQQEALVQALTNLLLNAVQAIPVVRIGAVAVHAEEQGERVRLVVEDDGVGMSDEELRHVFEPFHGTKPPGMGSGLGLAVARSLAESMHGSLRFESAVGRGSRAILELARAAPMGAADDAGIPGVGLPAAPPSRMSILVIDDDVQVLRSMARLLGRQHTVRIAAGVQEGLAAVSEQGFDLVICDVMMPRGGGERFWAELMLRAPGVDRPGGLHDRRGRHPRGARVPAPPASAGPDQALRRDGGERGAGPAHPPAVRRPRHAGRAGRDHAIRVVQAGANREALTEPGPGPALGPGRGRARQAMAMAALRRLLRPRAAPPPPRRARSGSRPRPRSAVRS